MTRVAVAYKYPVHRPAHPVVTKPTSELLAVVTLLGDIGQLSSVCLVVWCIVCVCTSHLPTLWSLCKLEGGSQGYSSGH